MATSYSLYPQSEKIYISGTLYPDLKVPMRQVHLSDGSSICLYDTCGIHTQAYPPESPIFSLEPIRKTWIEARADTTKLPKRPIRQARNNQAVTQLAYARQGIITPEVEFVAIRENQASCEQYNTRITPEFVRQEIAAKRAILPCNINHPELEPMIIGRNFLVKVNANIGNSALSSSITEEVNKIIWAIQWGADTVMDLSTGKEIHAICASILLFCLSPAVKSAQTAELYNAVFFIRLHQISL